MKLFQILCSFVVILASLSLLAAEKDEGSKKKKKTKNNVEDDDVTVEEISEEEYSEQQKQEAMKPPQGSRSDTKEKVKEEVKDNAKSKTKEEAKAKDTKTEDSKFKPGQPETGKTEETGTKNTGKEDETVKDEKPEETIQEAEGEYIEEDGEVEEDPEEEPEEEHEAPSGIRDPRPCEVCKYLAVELQGRLTETGKVKEYIETGHGIMPGNRKRKEYKKSELRFIEALHEPHVCEKLLEYDIHAERKKSLRYGKGQSETRKTLHWLRLKGVKVDMGMPEEMWTGDSPSSEITHLNRLCIDMVEMHEEALEDWYWGHQEQHLYNYLCRDRALKHKDQDCLLEDVDNPDGKKDDDEKDEEEESESSTDSESTTKGDEGVPSSSMPPAGDSSHAASPDPSPTHTPSPSSQTATPKTEL
ncbi:hypothetical protein ACOMHN_008142 [Nucella lapillus]